MRTSVRTTTQAELENTKPPEPKGGWAPRSHNELLNLVTNEASRSGIEIENVQLLTIRNAKRFLGFLRTNVEILDKRKLVIGICNSNDKSFPQGVFYGTREDYSELLLCSDPITRKSTKNAAGRFDEIMKDLHWSTGEYISATRELIGNLLSTNLCDQEAESILLRIYEQGIISTRNLPHAIRNWRKENKKNALSFLLAVDKSLQKRSQTNPKVYIDQSIGLRTFFEKLLNEHRDPDYQI